MPDFSIRLTCEQDTANFAARLAAGLAPGDTVLLFGDLGAGKTHFVRSAIQSLMRAAGVTEDVPSPTFTLVQTYALGDMDIWHADLYRISSADEAFELGLYEAFEAAICFVEWPDRLGQDLPSSALRLTLKMSDVPGERLLTADCPTSKWMGLLDKATANE